MAMASAKPLFRLAAQPVANKQPSRGPAKSLVNNSDEVTQEGGEGAEEAVLDVEERLATETAHSVPTMADDQKADEQGQEERSQELETSLGETISLYVETLKELLETIDVVLRKKEEEQDGAVTVGFTDNWRLVKSQELIGVSSAQCSVSDDELK